jgi:hypothetical protein
MNKVMKLIAVMCLAVTTLKAQSDFSSTWLNPQFKPGNILQNFNKPATDHSREIRSDDQSGILTPIYDSTYYWQWNAGTKTWEYNNKDVDIAYNPGNLVTSNVNRDWSFDEWKNESQITVTYNSCNLVSTEVTQTWSGTDWVYYSRTINTYNPCNLEVNSVVQIWSGNDWLNCFQQIPTYNSNNVEISNLIQKWNNTSWVNYSQTISTYNSFNDVTNYLYQMWNDGDWVNSSQTSNTYDSYDNLAVSIAQAWSGSAWVNYSKTTDFIFNSQNELTGFEAQLWEGDKWVKSGYITNSYNADNILMSYTVKNFDTKGTITSGDSVNYFFNRTVSSVADGLNANSTFKLYPNPANNIIHAVITLKQAAHLQLRLVNVQGQTVWSADAGNSATYQSDISVAGLPEGVYLFELVTGNSTETQKIMVEH